MFFALILVCLEDGTDCRMKSNPIPAYNFGMCSKFVADGIEIYEEKKFF